MKWAKRCLRCNHFLAKWKVAVGVNFCNTTCLHRYLEDKGQTEMLTEIFSKAEAATLVEQVGERGRS